MKFPQTPAFFLASTEVFLLATFDPHVTIETFDAAYMELSFSEFRRAFRFPFSLPLTYLSLSPPDRVATSQLLPFCVTW